MRLKRVKFIREVSTRANAVDKNGELIRVIRTAKKGLIYDLPDFAADHQIRLGNATPSNSDDVSEIEEKINEEQ
jgi:hypothetical protein